MLVVQAAWVAQAVWVVHAVRVVHAVWVIHAGWVVHGGCLTSLAPHERLPEILVVPREKTPTGAAARGNP